jgi:hypothetical protein
MNILNLPLLHPQKIRTRRPHRPRRIYKREIIQYTHSAHLFINHITAVLRTAGVDKGLREERHETAV